MVVVGWNSLLKSKGLGLDILQNSLKWLPGIWVAPRMSLAIRGVCVCVHKGRSGMCSPPGSGCSQFSTHNFPPKTFHHCDTLLFPPTVWPGGNHADSRAFSAHFPRVHSAQKMRGECAENTRRMRGGYASALRILSAYFPRILRAISAHLKI